MPTFFCGPAAARGGVDLFDMVEPLVLWSPFGPCPGVSTQRVPVPLAGSRVEPWLLAVGFASGSGDRSYAFFRIYPAFATDPPQERFILGSSVGFFVAPNGDVALDL